MSFEDMTKDEFRALLDRMTPEEYENFFMQPGSLIPLLKFGEPLAEDMQFVPVDEDGNLISDAEWIARAEAGRPMMVRLATLPPEPEEQT